MRPASLALGLALLSGAVAGCVHDPSKDGADAGVSVEAEGWTPLDAQKPLETKRRALAEAQKNAVEKALGVTVTATTKVESAITLEQMIRANIGGYIRRYEILSEREADGFMKTRIRAFVLYKPPELPPEAANRIRISVLCADKRLAQNVRATMTVQGFTVDDPAGEADYVVKGNARVHSLGGSAYPGLHSGRARVSLDATQRGTQAAFQSVQEATGLDVSEDIANDKALDIAAGLAAEDLSVRLKEALGIPKNPVITGKP